MTTLHCDRLLRTHSITGELKRISFPPRSAIWKALFIKQALNCPYELLFEIESLKSSHSISLSLGNVIASCHTSVWYRSKTADVSPWEKCCVTSYPFFFMIRIIHLPAGKSCCVRLIVPLALWPITTTLLTILLPLLVYPTEVEPMPNVIIFRPAIDSLFIVISQLGIREHSCYTVPR